MRKLSIQIACVLLGLASLLSGAATVSLADEPKSADNFIRSAKSGPWSAPGTWEGGSVPGTRARVQIREDHTVVFDVANSPVIRFVHVGGKLTFARDRNTQLNVCLLKISPGPVCSEDGFDCDANFLDTDPAKNHAVLEVGSPNEPMPSKYNAKIVLTYIDGLNKESLPALVCCGGRMDLHGSPLKRTWVKLGATAKKGSTRVVPAEKLEGWKVGDRIIITASRGDRDTSGSRRPGVGNREVETEQRTIKAIDAREITLDQPLTFDHQGEGEFRAAVANLSRNVVVASADPKGARGHTMYHRGSSGAISYAEFAHLGKENVLGRYSIHYHLVGNTMRGSYVIGASIWDSHNRWITIHGTNYLVVRDCVGYQSVGHGFFLEDGTETFNVLDRNLAVQAFVGKRLPRQVLPFDANDGAGFWWANSLNTFTNNVACENDRYGFRFEATQGSAMKMTLPVLQRDGNRKIVDIRTLPFVRFENNEAHCDGRYGVNLGEGVNRVGPDESHPFIVRGLKIWQVHYAFRPQSPCMMVENLHIHQADYGIYHPNYDRHVYKNVTIAQTNTEPFNRGHDDLSIQYGPLTVDGLTFADLNPRGMTMVQLSDHNPTGKAETHIRNLKVVGKTGKRAVVDLGGGPRPKPKTATSVPVYVHDYFSKGVAAKVVSVKSREQDGLDYKEMEPLTGSQTRVAQVKGVIFPKVLDPVDDLAPATVITHISKRGSQLHIRGTASDNGTIVKVIVNGQDARPIAPNFAEWEITLPAANQASAQALDQAGNKEIHPHSVTVR